MPQTSPMNWMALSTLMMALIKTMYPNNMNFQTSMIMTKMANTKKNLSWKW